LSLRLLGVGGFKVKKRIKKWGWGLFQMFLKGCWGFWMELKCFRRWLIFFGAEAEKVLRVANFFWG